MNVNALRGVARHRAGGHPALSAALLGLAAAGWWWSARMAGDMDGGASGMGGMEMAPSLSLAAFVLAWVAMMAAMMLPAVGPVVQLYARAATRGRIAPVPFFVMGYLAVWTVTALPGYFAWRALEAPLAEGQAWTGRVAGAVLAGAALWQLTPLKGACLRHCRSPMGFFLQSSARLHDRTDAARAGGAHGLFCLGCCWALFAVLVALGTMNLAWMGALTALVFLEKRAPRGELVAVAGGLAFAVLAGVLLIEPSIITHIT